MNVRILLMLTFLGAPYSAQSYELATHGALTKRAHDRSVLAQDMQLAQDLGIVELLKDMGDAYFDVSGSAIQLRYAQDAEGRIIDGILQVRPLSIQGWLMRGAIREDDIPGSPFLTDDPVNATRVLNHFYDPVYQRPLTVLGPLGETAPNWAVGATDAFLAPANPESGRLNHFTVFDARESMYRALTGRDASGNVVSDTETERNKYWATTFRALGDVVHLLQDMAQPQHTRNDPHAQQNEPRITPCAASIV